MGRAGVIGLGVLLATFISRFFVSLSSARDGKGWACGRLRPGGTRGVDERTDEYKEHFPDSMRDLGGGSSISRDFVGGARGGKSWSSGKLSAFPVLEHTSKTKRQNVMGISKLRSRMHLYTRTDVSHDTTASSARDGEKL